MGRRMLWLRLVLVELVGAIFLVVMIHAVWASPVSHGGDDYEVDQVVVKLNPAAGATITDINTTYGTTVIETLLHSAGIYLLQLPAGGDAKQVAELMEEDPRLLYAEPNYIGEAPEADPSAIYAWGGYDATPFREQYAAQALDLGWAHEINQGRGTIVAVLDTGVQLDHPALAASLTITRYDFVDDDPIPEDEPNGLDDDGDTFVDEAVGHGTHVAGIVHLVAPEAQIMPLRVLDSDGHGNIFVVAEALLYAARNGAQVVNLSMGSPWRSELMKEVIEDITQQGVVVVAAAGNRGTSVQQYPAAEDYVLAVTSVGITGTKSAFANYGDWIDVAAPGESIYSTYPGNSYAWWSGTSMATPFVAGQAALIRSVAPWLSAELVSKLITQTARPLDALNIKYAGLLGAGEPDIGASLGCHWADVWPDPKRNILQNTCDNVIDGYDVQAEAGAWRTTNNEAAFYDNDGDGDVDVRDVQRVMTRWGMRRPTAGN